MIGSEPKLTGPALDAWQTYDWVDRPPRCAHGPAHAQRGCQTETRSTSNAGRSTGWQRLLRTLQGLHRAQLLHLLTHLPAQVMAKLFCICDSSPCSQSLTSGVSLVSSQALSFNAAVAKLNKAALTSQAMSPLQAALNRSLEHPAS